LHGFETWSAPLKLRYGVTVFENRMKRIIFGPKRNAVTGGWRKLLTEELRNLYLLQILIE
jgi:hypothetical protein